MRRWTGKGRLSLSFMSNTCFAYGTLSGDYDGLAGIARLIAALACVCTMAVEASA